MIEKDIKPRTLEMMQVLITGYSVKNAGRILGMLTLMGVL
jgi:hypothetical protein